MQPSQKPSLILVVDDNEEQLLLISYALLSFNYSNYTFVAALDAHTALSIARDQQPALILLDIVMPEVSGIELVQELKQDGRTQDIPIVAVTALAKEEQEFLLAWGCNDCLTKPYLISQLKAVIEASLPKELSIAQ
ncbi:MAG: PleD family two-component system response regulator [Cyanophyceae cyanobacterium]